MEEREREIQWEKNVQQDSDSNVESGNESDVESTDDVLNWLSKLGYDQYRDVFKENGVDGDVLKTLTGEELRVDLKIYNLRHRRDILHAIEKLNESNKTKAIAAEKLPEHGRILDHLSNVRTYHSWLRVGVQLLGFSIVTLRLTPKFIAKELVTVSSLYFAIVGMMALMYGIYRYKCVITMIERSGAKSPAYDPDRFGVMAMLILVGVASIVSLAMIIIRFVN